MHDYIFYSIAAVLYFIIYLDVRRSDKKLKKLRRRTINEILIIKVKMAPINRIELHIKTRKAYSKLEDEWQQALLYL